MVAVPLLTANETTSLKNYGIKTNLKKMIFFLDAERNTTVSISLKYHFGIIYRTA